MSERKDQTVYLHLGTYKTATTFLQRVLWKSYDNPGGDIYYPRAGIYGNAHHYLTTESFPGWTNGVTPEEYEQAWKHLLADISGSKAASIVISSEMFCSLSLARIRYIRETLRDYPVRAIVYLRRQDQYISSMAAQMVKGCNGKPEYYTDLNRAVKFVRSEKQFDYEIICDKWASVIGKDNLVVRPFERKQLHKEDILADFFHYLLGMTVPQSAVLPERNINPRLCRDALEFKQLVNRLPTDRDTKIATLPGLLEYSRKIDSGTQNIYQEHVLLPLPERRKILHQCADGNANIARTYLGREDGVLFMEPLNEPVVEWKPYPGLNVDTIEAMVGYLGETNPGVVELLARAALSADKNDAQLLPLVKVLKRYVNKNRSIASLMPTSLLRSRPIRVLGRFLAKTKKAPAVAAPKHQPEQEIAKQFVPALFLHIRKTGGTSIVMQAMDHYGYENVCGHGDYMGKPPPHFKNLPFVSGHFGFDYARELMPGRFSFTFLRDPVERILSLYSFCRVQDPEEFPIYRAASDHDLDGFLRAAEDDGLVRAYIWNSQVWCLAAGPGYVETLETVAQPDEMFNQALENIKQLSFVGMIETFDADAGYIMRALNMNAGEKVRKDNVTRDRISVEGLPEKTLQLLADLTEWDRKLYDTVRRKRDRLAYQAD